MTENQHPVVASGADHAAFPRLNQSQLAFLSPYGSVRPTTAGEVLFRADDRGYDFYVVLSGAVAIVDDFGTPRERTLVEVGPDQFLGEMNLVTREAIYVTAVVREAGEVLVIPRARMRDVVSHQTEVGNLILRTFIRRRELMMQMEAGPEVIGSRYSRDYMRLCQFLARNRLYHHAIDLETDAGAAELLGTLGVDPADTPVVIAPDGSVLRNPSNAELAVAVGLSPAEPEHATYDLVVIGAGPGGLAASVYGASEGLRTATLDFVAIGGQASTSARIENYVGFPSGVSGSELADAARLQAMRLGAEFLVPREAVSLTERDGLHVVGLADGNELVARAVIIATGVSYRRLPVPGLEEFEGVSVYYSATSNEARLCRDQPVCVVGGGNSAGQAAVALAAGSKSVHVLVRDEGLTETMSAYLIAQIAAIDNIEVLTSTTLVRLEGDEGLERVVVADTRSGAERSLDARSLFIFVGAEPRTEWLRGAVAMDDSCFVLTDNEVPAAALQADPWRALGRAPFTFETSRPGVFAVGDVRSGSVKRVASAVGEGSMCVRMVHQYLDSVGD